MSAVQLRFPYHGDYIIFFHFKQLGHHFVLQYFLLFYISQLHSYVIYELYNTSYPDWCL
jgi:hypothetical protein